MSDDAQDVTTEAAEAAQAASDEIAEGSPVAEAPAEEAAADAPAEEPAAETPVAEESADAEPVAEDAPVAEPVAEETLASADPVAEEAPAEEPVAEAADDEPAAEEAPTTVGEAFGPVRVARVYVCERGHRTTTLWGEPDTCQAQPLRHGPNCGLTLYHITELPEQVQKALNPLKASKKASKKK